MGRYWLFVTDKHEYKGILWAIALGGLGGRGNAGWFVVIHMSYIYKFLTGQIKSKGISWAIASGGSGGRGNAGWFLGGVPMAAFGKEDQRPLSAEVPV